jgi:hypothetical protein
MKSSHKTIATPTTANTANGIAPISFRYAHGCWAEAKQTSENAGMANFLGCAIRRIASYELR